MEYKRIVEGLNDKGKLIPADANIFDYVRNTDKDYYLSTFLYNEEQKKQFDASGTVSGVTDVTTDKIWFDFDSEFEPEEAKKSAVVLIDRLIASGIDRRDIFISFSGNKGFGIEVNIDQALVPKEVKDICFDVVGDLPHFDVKMYNASRIFRVYGTRHQKTGLYKIPLTYSEIKEFSVDEIMDLAKSPASYNEEEFRWNRVSLPTSLYQVREAKAPALSREEKKEQLEDIDFTKKIKGWSNCKWALSQGYQIVSGDRHEKLLCVVATSKALNYSKEQAYYTAKNADEQGVLRNKGSKANKEDIWQMVESVYSELWKGGTFSCRDGKTDWLSDLCNGLGGHKCKQDDQKIFSELTDLSSIFNNFAVDIEKNKIKTGIQELDDNVILCTSMLCGLLGNPGSGKTSLSLNILNNCSKNGIPSIFFSMDMGIPIVYLKLIQKHYQKDITSDRVFEIYKTDKEEAAKIDKVINDNYNNVKFCFRSGLNVDAIRESIITYQQDSGQKVKLVVVDYLECIAGPYSDSTANTAMIANQLKDLANETETCILLLLQTQKHAAAPDEPLLSMKNIKGSSVIEQACSVILSVWREGYSPNYSKMDKFMSIATVKDRLNSLWKSDFKWNGLRGLITELEDFEIDELNEFRDQKKKDKSAQASTSLF